jgi:hypothetical protein
VVEGKLGEGIHRVPGGVGGQQRVDIRRDEAEKGGRELAAIRVTGGVAPGAELLQVRELADVHLRGQLPSHRSLQRLGGPELAAGERPPPHERLARPLPQQALQKPGPHLEHDRENDVSRRCGRIAPRFLPHSRKP